MLNFKEFCATNEAKQVGIIYHFTTPEAILKILSKQNTSLGLCDILGFVSHNGYISTSRDYAEVICPTKNERIFNLKDYVEQIMVYNHSHPDSSELKDKIQEIISNEKLDIEVILSRKWVPFKESHAAFNEQKGYILE